jgi:hypothetical protein
MDNSPPPERPPSEIPVVRVPWRSFVVIGGSFGASVMAVVNNWAAIEPVLESPSMIMIAMLGLFGLGALSAYWVVARPHEERLVRAEGVIKGLRSREYDLLKRDAEKSAAIARLETTVEFLRKEIEQLRAAMPVEGAPQRRSRRPKAPPGT